MPPDFQRPFALPNGATEVILVRHGSTESGGDAMALIDGHADPPLSERGRRQAVVVAERLADEPVAALFVTPLRRTIDSAAPLATRCGHEPVVVHDLREVYLGDWEHDFRARLASKDPLSVDVFAEQRWDLIPNAEDMAAFGARVRRGMDRIADAVGPDAAGVAFVHGGVVAEICRQATGSTPFAFLYAENASVSRVLRLPSGRWTLRAFNDISHLATLGAAEVADGQTRLIGGGRG